MNGQVLTPECVHAHPWGQCIRPRRSTNPHVAFGALSSCLTPASLRRRPRIRLRTDRLDKEPNHASRCPSQVASPACHNANR
jgi:hypothetical protein